MAMPRRLLLAFSALRNATGEVAEFGRED